MDGNLQHLQFLIDLIVTIYNIRRAGAYNIHRLHHTFQCQYADLILSQNNEIFEYYYWMKFTNTKFNLRLLEI